VGTFFICFIRPWKRFEFELCVSRESLMLTNETKEYRSSERSKEILELSTDCKRILF
jgi:hypothetical protein